MSKVLISHLLFADDAAMATHKNDQLQGLMDFFSQACQDVGLTISLRRINVMGQDVEVPLPLLS